MLYYSYFNWMLVPLIFIATHVRYNFKHMSQAMSSEFANYICDIFSEYITPCAVMTYAMSNAIWVMPPRLHTLCLQDTVWSN
jgi:hypothetical protein